MHLALFLRDFQLVKAKKLSFQHRAGIEIFEPLGSAGTGVQLLWCVTLKDQKSAGFERAPHARPFQTSFRRQAELRENLDDDVEGGFGIIPCMGVGLQKGDIDTALGCQSSRFL